MERVASIISAFWTDVPPNFRTIMVGQLSYPAGSVNDGYARAA
jgi:hypothetical protein